MRRRRLKASSFVLLVVATVIVLCCIGTVANLKRISHTENLDQDASFSLPLNEQNAFISEKYDASASPSPINDKTLPWNASKDRLWLRHMATTAKNNKPSAVVTLTSMYWNHENQTFGLSNFRTRRSRQLLEGVLNHPLFHPTAWDEMVAGRWPDDDDTRIYAFFDSETCAEQNYPLYGKGIGGNADAAGNRSTDWKTFHPQNPFRALTNASAFWRYASRLKVVIFDCGGNGPKYFCLGRNHNPLQQISLASISAMPWHHFPQDQGFPPPIVKEIFLNETIRKNIADCREDTRPYLVTFAGNFRSPVRKQLRDFVHNGKDALFGNSNMISDMGMDYEELVRLSKFGAAPRGDNPFSYRFVEVMSGGAIPVLYADDLVLPFESVIDWTEISVRIPQNQTNRTRDILMAIGDEKRCRMRQKMLEVFERYIRTGEAQIAGIIDALEEKYRTNQWMQI